MNISVNGYIKYRRIELELFKEFLVPLSLRLAMIWNCADASIRHINAVKKIYTKTKTKTTTQYKYVCVCAWYGMVSCVCADIQYDHVTSIAQAKIKTTKTFSLGTQAVLVLLVHLLFV